MKTDDLSLIASINHATDTLGLYRAELARILELNCADVSDSHKLELLIKSSLAVRSRAELFVRLFYLLETVFPDDMALIINWLHKDNNELGTTPLLAMVDQGRLSDVVDALQEYLGSE
jgi:hypothetical protein